MNRQALRSAYSRAGSGLPSCGQPATNYFRSFSTTQWRAADDNSNSTPSKPSVRQRGQQNAAEITSMVKSRGGAGRGGRARFARPAKAPMRGAKKPDGKQKVIDVRSLPAGFRGRGGGGLRGRGGSRGGVEGGHGGGRGVGGGRGRGGGSGRGRGDGYQTQEGRQGGDRAPRTTAESSAADKQMDAEEQAFQRALAHGERITFKPGLDVESLRSFMPAVPSGAADGSALVVDNLSVLGATDPVGTPQGLHTRSYVRELQERGLRFFADPADKEDAEALVQEMRRARLEKAGSEGEDGDKTPAAPVGRMIRGPEESVKSVILDRAVGGRYEKPAFAQDPRGVARSWHLRSGTYTQRDVDLFEKKLDSLLNRAGGAAPATGKGKGKKQLKA